ncbi:unnamed protein product [Pieris macdunnoughi]|uniref:Reverse transcriptase domain-containing protein n=1 Tax=Pieris macdunnoughi TaxID=345717 RepID=A0A821N3P3_9NEOP|nr:unnamed protein product [Pieris macdunnoughi]
MTKAYDKVQFDILLDKLYNIGIRGDTHVWFKSYLFNRQQQVEIEHFDHKSCEIQHIRSESRRLKASIPQGSVIGCLLFLIYINDLPKVMHEPCILFVDDISILISGENKLELNTKLQMTKDKADSWLRLHNLEINYEKTKLMTFHPYQKTLF